MGNTQVESHVQEGKHNTYYNGTRLKELSSRTLLDIPDDSIHPDKNLPIDELYLAVISYVQRKIKGQLCSQSMIQPD